jgi:hypothetical protein
VAVREYLVVVRALDRHIDTAVLVPVRVEDQVPILPLDQQLQVSTACSGLSFILVMIGLNFSFPPIAYLRKIKPPQADKT